MNKIIVAVLLILSLTGCGLTINDKIVGNYYLEAVDTQQELTVCYRDPDETTSTLLIDQTVFAVGHNDQYIIAKQHPSKFGKSIDKKNTCYFILPVTTTPEAEIAKPIGPLTMAEFDLKRKELGIEAIAFTTVYSELE